MKAFHELIQPSTTSMSIEQRMKKDNLLSGLAESADLTCLDSNIGKFCAMLAMKNCVKRSIGEIRQPR